MSFLKKQHKAEKQDLEELKKLNDEINDKFARFQLDNNVRAQILHPFLGNYIVSKVMEDAALTWRPLKQDEKSKLSESLAKKSGIDIIKTN